MCPCYCMYSSAVFIPLISVCVCVCVCVFVCVYTVIVTKHRSISVQIHIAGDSGSLHAQRPKTYQPFGTDSPRRQVLCLCFKGGPQETSPFSQLQRERSPRSIASLISVASIMFLLWLRFFPPSSLLPPSPLLSCLPILICSPHGSSWRLRREWPYRAGVNKRTKTDAGSQWRDIEMHFVTRYI